VEHRGQRSSSVHQAAACVVYQQVLSSTCSPCRYAHYTLPCCHCEYLSQCIHIVCIKVWSYKFLLPANLVEFVHSVLTKPTKIKLLVSDNMAQKNRVGR
jgi:hypothetical protein